LAATKEEVEAPAPPAPPDTSAVQLQREMKDVAAGEIPEVFDAGKEVETIIDRIDIRIQECEERITELRTFEKLREQLLKEKEALTKAYESIRPKE
jgi:TolA-binding protein